MVLDTVGAQAVERLQGVGHFSKGAGLGTARQTAGHAAAMCYAPSSNGCKSANLEHKGANATLFANRLD